MKHQEKTVLMKDQKVKEVKLKKKFMLGLVVSIEIDFLKVVVVM